MDNIHKQAGQLFVVGFDGKQMTDHIKHMIHTYHIGAVILFARNIGTPKEILQLTNDLQYEAKKAGYKRPLLICLDQENGVVRRIENNITQLPGAMTLGATHKPENAFKVGTLTAKELKALGINWNLSPTIDINNNPKNPVIGVRSFGDNAQTVATFGVQLMQGMQSEGIATTLKHFPGHGDTSTDSHFSMPVIKHSLEQLKENELIPFTECINNGADAVLTAHVAFPQLTNKLDLPATLSHEIVTGLLRDKMNFNGVITTDCMEMDAIAKGVGTVNAATKAIQAGVDFVMVSHTQETQENAIKKVATAIQNGEISTDRIYESTKRINELKDKYTNWNNFNFDEIVSVPSFVGSDEHLKIATDIYQQGVTIVRNHNTIPLAKNKNVLIISPQRGGSLAVEHDEHANYDFGDIFKHHIPDASVIQIPNEPDEQLIDSITVKAENFDVVIIGTVSLTPTNKQIALIQAFIKQGIEVIAVAIRNPYDIIYLPNEVAYVCTYEFSALAIDIAAQAILNNIKVSGTLPVHITNVE